jgi:putative membrane protein
VCSGSLVCLLVFVKAMLISGLVENHHPLPRFTSQIMSESLDISPSFLRYYRARLVTRVGEGDEDVLELDKRCKRGGEEWIPSFD